MCTEEAPKIPSHCPTRGTESLQTRFPRSSPVSSLLKAFIHGLLFPVLSFTQVKLKLQSSLESFTKIPLCVRGLEKESDCFLGKKNAIYAGRIWSGFLWQTCTLEEKS